MVKRIGGVCLGLAVVAGTPGAAGEETIDVPNASFESPETGFADPRIDAWVKTPKPPWYDESGGFFWDQLTGVFKNTEPGSPEHIDNVDGEQAIFLFAIPETGLFLDHDSIDPADSVGLGTFDTKYEAGKSYRLTVGLLGGGGILEGVSLSIGLYYRDQEGERVTAEATTVVYSTTVFSNSTHLVDFQVNLPTVSVDDPWAGQHIGVEFVSTVLPELVGGYWDLDNVRLTASSGPILLNPAMIDGQFGFTVESEPGLTFEILRTLDPGLPVSEWTVLGTVTNQTGSVPFIDTETDAASGAHFYQARQLP